MVNVTTQKILSNYKIIWEAKTITEEEFVYDSLQNDIFFTIIQNINIHMMHLSKEFGSSCEDNQNKKDEDLETVSNPKNKESSQGTRR